MALQHVGAGVSKVTFGSARSPASGYGSLRGPGDRSRPPSRTLMVGTGTTHGSDIAACHGGLVGSSGPESAPEDTMTEPWTAKHRDQLLTRVSRAAQTPEHP